MTAHRERNQGITEMAARVEYGIVCPDGELES